jgi:hypothetical protein
MEVVSAVKRNPVRDPDPLSPRVGGAWRQNLCFWGPGPFPRKSLLGAQISNLKGAACRPRWLRSLLQVRTCCLETGQFFFGKGLPETRVLAPRTPTRGTKTDLSWASGSLKGFQPATQSELQRCCSFCGRLFSCCRRSFILCKAHHSAHAPRRSFRQRPRWSRFLREGRAGENAHRKAHIKAHLQSHNIVHIIADVSIHTSKNIDTRKRKQKPVQPVVRSKLTFFG